MGNEGTRSATGGNIWFIQCNLLHSRIFCCLLLLVTAVVLLIAAAVKRSLWDESNDAAVRSEVTLTQTLLAFMFHMKMLDL